MFDPKFAFNCLLIRRTYRNTYFKKNIYIESMHCLNCNPPHTLKAADSSPAPATKTLIKQATIIRSLCRYWKALYLSAEWMGDDPHSSLRNFRNRIFALGYLFYRFNFKLFSKSFIPHNAVLAILLGQNVWLEPQFSSIFG